MLTSLGRSHVRACASCGHDISPRAAISPVTAEIMGAPVTAKTPVTAETMTEPVTADMLNPFALNTDGTACDPAAFQLALKNDAAKMKALQSEPDVLQIVLGDDIPAMQNMLRSAYQVSRTTAVTLRTPQT